jgi:hypothetical protein
MFNRPARSEGLVGWVGDVTPDQAPQVAFLQKLLRRPVLGYDSIGCQLKLRSDLVPPGFNILLKLTLDAHKQAAAVIIPKSLKQHLVDVGVAEAAVVVDFQVTELMNDHVVDAVSMIGVGGFVTALTLLGFAAGQDRPSTPTICS